MINSGREWDWMEILEDFPDVEFLKADGFDDAIIGFEENSFRLIYSISKCLIILQEDMNEEDAIEHFYYNVSGSYVGEKTPIWCNDITHNKSNV